VSPSTVSGAKPNGSDPHPPVDLIPREFLRALAVWSLIPAYLAAGAFGWLADKVFHTSPYGIGIGLLIALVMSVRDVLRLKDDF
jgi:hypothetical protein